MSQKLYPESSAMNDHNLDDLIIDTMEPNNNKAKSFLTIIALIIVALIVGIMFIKTMESDPKNTNIGLEENMTDLISSELTLKSDAKIDAPKEESKLSSMIEEKLATPAKTEEIKKETVVVKEEVSVPKKVAATPVPKTPKVPAKTEVAKKAPAKPVETEKVVVPKSTYHEKIEPKKTTVKAEPAPKVVVPKPNHPAATVHYYIQVGSFSQTPSTRFLNTIKKHGFSYKITTAAAKGTKKLLIGPYPSRAEADTALVHVKDRINKGAFIVKK
jgi:DedD protein